ncbi:unnamed protein product, partial [Gulo gulo]
RRGRLPDAEAGSLRLPPVCCRHLPVSDHLLHQLHRLACHLLWLQLRVIGTVGNSRAGPPPVHKQVAQVREFYQRQGVCFKPSWVSMSCGGHRRRHLAPGLRTAALPSVSAPGLGWRQWGRTVVRAGEGPPGWICPSAGTWGPPALKLGAKRHSVVSFREDTNTR